MIRISTYFSIALFGLVCGACDADMPAAEASAHTPDGTAKNAENAANAPDPNAPEAAPPSETSNDDSTKSSGNPEKNDIYPLPGETRPSQNDSSESGDDDSEKPLTGVVNLNEASLEQLQLLPGIGPAIADRIATYRKERRFEQTDDITSVRGIGDATYEKLEQHISVEGPTTLTE